ncbi:Omp28-related outer membrane protein [Bacteroidia bacterium]|nr:Omp28-related outer membrane protein [Bacteroidia bacterium]
MKIKFRLIVLTAVTMAFVSCKKDQTNGGDNGSGNQTNNEPQDEVITAPPTSFDAKGVVEVFGGEWCAACPSGIEVLQNLVSNNPDDIYGAVLHSNDDYETINYNQLFAHLGGVSSHPRGAINRSPAANSGDQNDYVAVSMEHWGTNLNRYINKKTTIGLAIESVEDSTKMNIKVFVRGNGFDNSKSYKLTVYIIEDNISTDNQVGKPAGFKHQMVLRGSLTNAIGDDIKLKENVTLEKEYSFSLSGSFVVDNLKMLAFVNTVGGTTSDRLIHNAQQVKAGKTANWD